MKDQGDKFLKRVTKEFLWDQLKDVPEINDFFNRIEMLETNVAQLQEEISDLRNNPPVKQKLCDCCDPKQPVMYETGEKTYRIGGSNFLGTPSQTGKRKVRFYKCKKTGTTYPLNHSFSEG